MNKLKVGDKVRIIGEGGAYFDYPATIIETDKSNIPYLCELKNYNGEIIRNWYTEDSLILEESAEKYFRVSIKKHKHINLKFNI